MRVIPTRAHAVLDYLVAVLLIAAPWLLDFAAGGAETWVPVVLGAATILYSLFTDYEAGVRRNIAMPAHLALDLTAGAVLAISPWLFGFADDVYWPHLMVGLVEIVVSLTTRAVPELPRTAGGNER